MFKKFFHILLFLASLVFAQSYIDYAGAGGTSNQYVTLPEGSFTIAVGDVMVALITCETTIGTPSVYMDDDSRTFTMGSVHNQSSEVYFAWATWVADTAYATISVSANFGATADVAVLEVYQFRFSSGTPTFFDTVYAQGSGTSFETSGLSPSATQIVAVGGIKAYNGSIANYTIGGSAPDGTNSANTYSRSMYTLYSSSQTDVTAYSEMASGSSIVGLLIFTNGAAGGSAPVIDSITPRVDTIGQSGVFGHDTTEGLTSANLLGTWPDSAAVHGTAYDSVAYHWKQKAAKAGYQFEGCNASGCDTTIDTITIVGPSVSYAASQCTVGVAFSLDVGSTALADSFTLADGVTLPDGLSLTISGANIGRISGTPTGASGATDYLIITWRADYKADSGNVNLTVIDTSCSPPVFSATPGAQSDTTYDTIPLELSITANDGVDSLHLISGPGTIEFSGTNDSVYLILSDVFPATPCSISIYGCTGTSGDTIVFNVTSVWDAIAIDSLLNGSGDRYSNNDTVWTGDTIDVTGWYGKYFTSTSDYPAWLTIYDSSNTSLKFTVDEMTGDSIGAQFTIAICDTHSCDTAADTVIYAGNRTTTQYTLSLSSNNNDYGTVPFVSAVVDSGGDTSFVVTTTDSTHLYDIDTVGEFIYTVTNDTAFACTLNTGNGTMTFNFGLDTSTVDTVFSDHCTMSFLSSVDQIFSYGELCSLQFAMEAGYIGSVNGGALFGSQDAITYDTVIFNVTKDTTFTATDWPLEDSIFIVILGQSNGDTIYGHSDSLISAIQAANPGYYVSLHKYCVGGSGLMDGSPRWADRGSGTYISNAAAVINALDSINYVVWYQGEGDPTAGYIQNEYQDTLKILFDDLRDSITVPKADMKYLICQVRSGYTEQQNYWFYEVEKAQYDICDGDSILFGSSSTGLAGGTGLDFIHLLPASAQSVGRQLAHAVNCDRGVASDSTPLRITSHSISDTRDTIFIGLSREIRDCGHITGFRFWNGNDTIPYAECKKSGDSSIIAVFNSPGMDIGYEIRYGINQIPNDSCDSVPIAAGDVPYVLMPSWEYETGTFRGRINYLLSSYILGEGGGDSALYSDYMPVYSPANKWTADFTNNFSDTTGHIYDGSRWVTRFAAPAHTYITTTDTLKVDGYYKHYTWLARFVFSETGATQTFAVQYEDGTHIISITIQTGYIIEFRYNNAGYTQARSAADPDAFIDGDEYFLVCEQKPSGAMGIQLKNLTADTTVPVVLEYNGTSTSRFEPDAAQLQGSYGANYGLDGDVVYIAKFNEYLNDSELVWIDDSLMSLQGWATGDSSQYMTLVNPNYAISSGTATIKSWWSTFRTGINRVWR